MSFLDYIPFVGDIANQIISGARNTKSRRFAMDMYNRQRSDALADWNMQNEYNSPASQMQRYKMAGLNPNLIYGQMNEGATVRSSTAQGWNPDAPSLNTAQALNAVTQRAAQKNQESQTQAQLQLMEQEKLLKIAQTIATYQGVDSSKFDLDQKKRLADNSYEAAVEGLNKAKAEIAHINAGTAATEANTTYTKDSNRRAEQLQKYTIQEIKQKIKALDNENHNIGYRRALLIQQIGEAIKNNQLKEYEIELNNYFKTAGAASGIAKDALKIIQLLK